MHLYRFKNIWQIPEENRTTYKNIVLTTANSIIPDFLEAPSWLLVDFHFFADETGQSFLSYLAGAE